MVKQKQSGFSHLIIVVVILTLTVIGTLGFVFYQNFFTKKESKISANVGNFNNSELVSRINMNYPGLVESVYEVKQTKGSFTCLPLSDCSPKNLNWYKYEGFFYPKQASFSMPFSIEIREDPDKNDSIEIGGIGSSGNDAFAYNNWAVSFVSTYNLTKQKNFSTAEFLMGYLIGSFTTDPNEAYKESKVIAGYELGHLLLVFAKDDGYSYEDYSNGNLPDKQTKDSGVYLFYYDAKDNKWSILTDDGRYFVYWVKYQTDKKGLQLNQIDWSKSPIKPYGNQ